MDLENFATKTTLGIFQEFHATTFSANIYYFLAQDVEDEIRVIA